MGGGVYVFLLVFSISIWLVLAYLIGYDRGEQDTKQEMYKVCEESCVD